MILLPLPPGEGRGEGVLAAERGTDHAAGTHPGFGNCGFEDPLTSTLSQRERGQA